MDDLKQTGTLKISTDNSLKSCPIALIWNQQDNPKLHVFTHMIKLYLHTFPTVNFQYVQEQNMTGVCHLKYVRK